MGIAPCILTMTTDKNVSARFGLGPGGLGPVALVGLIGFGSLSDAYTAAGSNASVLTVAGIQTIDNLILDQGKDVTLIGGYDRQFTVVGSQLTTLQGSLMIRSGSLRVRGTAVQ